MDLHNERRNTNASPTSVRYISKFTDSSNASYMKPASEVSMNLSYDSSPTSIRYDVVFPIARSILLSATIAFVAVSVSSILSIIYIN